MAIIRTAEIKTSLPAHWQALEDAIWAAYVAREGLPADGELDLTLVDDATIQAVNRDHRQIDQATDVLSFPMYEDRDDLAEDLAAGLPIILGDIMISIPTARRQAEAYGHSFKRELAYLLVHGLLHVAGYDHMTAADKKAMRIAEEAILAQVGVPRDTAPSKVKTPVEDEARERLVEAARKAREGAYAPYSNYRVGAALLASDGRIFTGANVENASYGATCCAERTALFAAVTQDARDFTALAVATAGEAPAPPCGICRQALAEFAPNLTLYLVGRDRADLQETNLADLFPQAFSLSPKEKS
ncbi:rRNA maturation RNase YbeY [Peptococcus simiae]|uniref:Endoribonuclease YbeY n=1 Tax=Peptococcus simiae TaxID=1643805 RepID=A0ABW9GYI5_9FIRM